MRTRVKMCAMTRIEDALLAAQLGADAVGLIFYELSPRFIAIPQAKKIIAQLPPYISTVGVFANAKQDFIENTLNQVPLDLLQFQGDETPQECEIYHKPYVKAVHMNTTDKIDFEKIIHLYANAKALLLDSKIPGGLPGGTGKIFDWSQIPKNLSKPIILAGGLTPENVATAIRQVQPYAVDVTSGIEAQKGIKDPEKMKAFMHAIDLV